MSVLSIRLSHLRLVKFGLCNNGTVLGSGESTITNLCCKGCNDTLPSLLQYSLPMFLCRKALQAYGNSADLSELQNQVSAAARIGGRNSIKHLRRRGSEGEGGQKEKGVTSQLSIIDMCPVGGILPVWQDHCELSIRGRFTT